MEIERKEYNGFDIVISQDEFAENPREWDNMGTCILFHKRYSVPNETSFNSNDYQNWEDIEKAINKKYGKCLILPVYMYDHSGIALSTSPFSCKWDSGKLGFIFVSYENIRKEFCISRVTKKQMEKAIKILQAEIEIFSNYMNGEVYSFTIEKDGDVKDSCSGFYGIDFEKNGLIDSAKEQIDSF